jgi:glyoxylate utilization-related uncharacterized protein
MILAFVALAAATVVNQEGSWKKEKDGSESITLREDATATEYIVRFPGGHVFRPHWHSVNERVLLLEGRLSLKQGDGPETFLDPGGYAYLPAKEVQRTKCVSTTRCTFYVFWDGKLDFHPAQ